MPGLLPETLAINQTLSGQSGLCPMLWNTAELTGTRPQTLFLAPCHHSGASRVSNVALAFLRAVLKSCPVLSCAGSPAHGIPCALYWIWHLALCAQLGEFRLGGRAFCHWTEVTLVYPEVAGKTCLGFSGWTLGFGARRKTGENAEKLHAAFLSWTKIQCHGLCQMVWVG